jgi:hypothetical protein
MLHPSQVFGNKHAPPCFNDTMRGTTKENTGHEYIRVHDDSHSPARMDPNHAALALGEPSDYYDYHGFQRQE